MLALIALAFPDLVTLGLFLGILPGLVLGFAPTAFGYLATTAIIRRLLPFSPRISSVIAASAAIGLGWLVTVPSQLAGKIRFQQASLGELQPPAPVRLEGAIRLERPFQRWGKRDEAAACDGLCAALLLTPGVTSVTQIWSGDTAPAPVRYSLAAKGSVPDAGLAPLKPGDLVVTLDMTRDGKASQFRSFAARADAKAAVEADWALRLSTLQTLVADTDAEQPNLTFRIISQPGTADHPSVHRVEVLDRTGIPLARREWVQVSVLSAPLTLDFGGSLEHARFDWRRKTLSTRARYVELHPIPELLQIAAISEPSAPADSPARMRTRLAAALAAPGQPLDLSLSSPWLKSLGYRVQSDQDAALIARVVEDSRIRDLSYLGELYPKQVPAALRAGLAARVLDPRTGTDDRRRFATMLARMPQGTFAQPNEAERAIWRRTDLQADVHPFYERIADQGAPGLPLLMETLDRVLTIQSWAKRRPMIRSVRRGLARLGPDASAALPRVQELFAMPGSPIINLWEEAQLWRMALLRMGLGPEQLTFPSQRPDQQARDRAAVVQMLQRYDPDGFDGYSY